MDLPGRRATGWAPRGLRERPAPWIALLLALLTLAVFHEAGSHPFVRFDDTHLITGNPRVASGLTWEGVKWAFTAPPSPKYHWQPLTWLSFMADVSLFGMDPGRHHLVSLLLHTLSTLVLFAALRRMTGAPWRSALVAALFAVHPLQVESVAWAAERKDTLSALFFMLALWAYGRHAEAPGRRRLLPVGVLFALGLAAKPMVLTLPFVLLLLDGWPLRRFPSSPPPGPGEPAFPRLPAGRLLLEKAPLLLLSAASAAVTLARRVPPVEGIEGFPLAERLANAPVAYVRYVGKALWPSGLAVFYPRPATGTPAWQAAGASLLLVAATALVLRRARPSPHLAVGWFWFVGMLVPAIGLVHVGSQAMSDHFAYLPLVGLSLAAAWSLPAAPPRRGRAAAAVAVAAVLALSLAAAHQFRYWRSDAALFGHALEVTGRNPVAHAVVGFVLEEEGRYAEAAEHYREVLRLAPAYDGRVRLGLANCLVRLGRRAEAEEVLPSLAGDPETANRFGMLLAESGKLEAAEALFREAVRQRPSFAEGHYNLAVALGRLGRREEALPHFREALAIPPADGAAVNRVGVALERLGRHAEAADRFREALRLDPALGEARLNLAVALGRAGDREGAAREYRELLRRDPSDREAREGLASVGEGANPPGGAP